MLICEILQIPGLLRNDQLMTQWKNAFTDFGGNAADKLRDVYVDSIDEMDAATGNGCNTALSCRSECCRNLLLNIRDTDDEKLESLTSIFDSQLKKSSAELRGIYTDEMTRKFTQFRGTLILYHELCEGRAVDIMQWENVAKLFIAFGGSHLETKDDIGLGDGLPSTMARREIVDEFWSNGTLRDETKPLFKKMSLETELWHLEMYERGDRALTIMTGRVPKHNEERKNRKWGPSR